MNQFFCKTKRKGHASATQAIDNGYPLLRFVYEFGFTLGHFSIYPVPCFADLHVLELDKIFKVIKDKFVGHFKINRSFSKIIIGLNQFATIFITAIF